MPSPSPFERRHQTGYVDEFDCGGNHFLRLHMPASTASVVRNFDDADVSARWYRRDSSRRDAALVSALRASTCLRWKSDYSHLTAMPRFLFRPLCSFSIAATCRRTR